MVGAGVTRAGGSVGGREITAPSSVVPLVTGGLVARKSPSLGRSSISGNRSPSFGKAAGSGKGASTSGAGISV